MMHRKGEKEDRLDLSAALLSTMAQIKTERDSTLRRELYINYITLSMMAQRTDPSIYMAALREISPGSIVWLLNPHSIYTALNRSGLKSKQHDEYVDRVIEENPSARVKAAVLFDEFMASKLSEHPDKAARYYELLVSKFGDTPEGFAIQKRFPDEIRLIVGKPAPSFSVASMDNSAELINNETLEGNYFLVDFWAKTNERSVVEMKSLTEAYKKFKDKKLQIVSLSVDSTSGQVLNFRKGKWKMPWLNGFLGSDKNNKTVLSFRITNVPQLFLVDPDGKLVAMGKDLQGKKLIETLNKFLNKQR